MYLGAKSGAAYQGGAKRFAYDPFGIAETGDETLILLWEKAYIIALATPLLLCALYIVPTSLGIVLPTLPLDGPLYLFEEVVFKVCGFGGFLMGQFAKFMLDVWNFICPFIFLKGAILKY